MKVLIIGAGQIGKAIYEIVKPFHNAQIRDVQDLSMDGVEILHICYPDGLYFVSDTMKYIDQYRPSLTIIHSSVAVGKTDQCGSHVVHCPVRGRHPNLDKEIPAFILFVGGNNKEDVIKACLYLEGFNVVTKPVYYPMATEACKLLSNIHMGVEIAWRQEAQRILDGFGIDSKVYEEWEDTYNMGYRITGDEQLTRPRLRPDPIGGHCILQCTEILSAQYPSHIFDFIKESNEKAKRHLTETARETVNA